MSSTRSGRKRPSVLEPSPPRTRKGVSPPRSPARARNSSPPARSPSRKSPSRKSPSRKPASKFPARKSPSRTTKEATETAAQKSPVKRTLVKSEISVKLEKNPKLDIYLGTRSRRSEYSIKDLSSSITSNLSTEKHEKINGIDSLLDSNDVYEKRNAKPIEEVIPHRSIRRREHVDIEPDIKRSLSKSISKSISLDAYSDEENSEEELLRKSTSVTRKLATPLRGLSELVQIHNRWEFGGRVGSAFLMLLIPLTIFSILISCMKSCSAKSLLDLSAYISLSMWFSLDVWMLIVGLYTIQAVFTLMPNFGTKTDRIDGTHTKYYISALFSSFFTLSLLFTLNFYDILNSNTLLNEYLRLAAVSYILAITMSVVLYLKNIDDMKLNPYGNTGYALYDFCVGREIQPCIKKWDVKIWITRVANINALILAILTFKHGFLVPTKGLEVLSQDNVSEFLSKVQMKPTIILFSMMQIVYVLNFIMKEYKIINTFFWQSEGLGYLQLVSSALYPFYFTTISKFIVDTDLSLSTNALISASILYVLGFFIMLVSNNIKYEFRKNPLHPSLAKLDSMPTFHGKKLLLSGLWGIVRHPNYTGDILIHIALALPGILSKQYVAAAPALLTILLLIHRSWRDHSRCRRRYGAAWERYCKRVPNILIPKVF